MHKTFWWGLLLGWGASVIISPQHVLGMFGRKSS